MAPLARRPNRRGHRHDPAVRLTLAVTSFLTLLAAATGCSSAHQADAAPTTTADPLPLVMAPPPTTEVEPVSTGPAAGAADKPCVDTAGRVDAHQYQSSVMRLVKPDQGYLVYTPPCYDARPEQRYPVVYLLHGANTDEHQWTDIGLAETADRLIAAGEIPPVVIALPDGLDGMGDYEGDPVPFDYFVLHEIVPLVEGEYRTIADGAHRAIGGISRGGEWALLVAGRNSAEFAAAGAHSAAVGPPSSPNPVLVPLLATAGVRVWLDVGAGDGLAGSVASLHGALDHAGIDHHYDQVPGGHDRAYWGSRVADYLRWYTAPWLTEETSP